MPRVTAEQRARVLELSGHGMATRQIAEQTGVSKSTVGSLLRAERAPVDADTPVNVPHQVEDMDSAAAQDFLRAVTAAPVPVTAPESGPKPGDIKRTGEAERFLANFLRDAPGPAVAPASPPAARVAPIALAPTPTAPPAAPPVDKETLVAKITLKVNAFEKHLGDILLPDKAEFLKHLSKRSRDDLAGVMRTVDLTISTQNLTNYFTMMLFVAANGVEMGTTKYLGLNTRGYTQALEAQRDDIQLIMKEMAMERADSFQRVQRPEMRLAMLMTTTLLAVNTQNSLRSAAGQGVGRQSDAPPRSRVVAPAQPPSTPTSLPVSTATRYEDL
jgi:hypothetical protein